MGSTKAGVKARRSALWSAVASAARHRFELSTTCVSGWANTQPGFFVFDPLAHAGSTDLVTKQRQTEVCRTSKAVSRCACHRAPKTTSLNRSTALTAEYSEK